MVSDPDTDVDEAAVRPKKKIKNLVIVGDEARFNFRLPKAFHDHLRGEADARGLSANLLVYAILYREFPMTESPKIEDLERAIRDFEAGEAPREEVLGLASALKGKPWYLSHVVVMFLGDLSLEKPERLHVQVILLRRAFRQGAPDPRFTTVIRDPESKDAPTIALRLLRDLDRSGVLTPTTKPDGDHRTAFSALMGARHETGHLLPGVTDCLIRCVECWKVENISVLEEPFRSLLLRTDWETILTRLQKLTQAHSDAASATKVRARRLIRVLRTFPPVADLGMSR